MSLKDYLSALKGKHVAVVGAGVSNRPLIRLLAEEGIHTTVCDRAEASALGEFYTMYSKIGVEFHLGESYLEGLTGDVIFRTPGMHPGHPALKAAVEKGCRLTSEMEAFFALCPCRIFAVTGSDGKTTVTSILAELLRRGGYKVWLGGNIGNPLLAHVDEIAPEDVAVLELSSFQLHSMTCSPDVAVITNLSPNHLDVHPDYEDYINAKRQIYLRQSESDRLVLNRDNADAARCAASAKGCVRWFGRREAVEEGVYLRADGVICRVLGGVEKAILPAKEIYVPGDHNVENMMAAFAAVEGFVSHEVMAETAKAFSGVAHRLEIIRTLRGVTYINDSIATSPTRTLAGLNCFEDNVVLIAGGKDKGLSFEELGDAICRHVKALYLTGATAEPIAAAVKGSASYDANMLPIHVVNDFSEAVLSAAAAAVEGDIVLLSPASTSFDRFKNFVERGNAFRDIVNKLE